MSKQVKISDDLTIHKLNIRLLESGDFIGNL